MKKLLFVAIMLLTAFVVVAQTPSLSGSGASTALTITWPSMPSCATSEITNISLTDPASGSTILTLTVASVTPTSVTSSGSLILDFLDPTLDYDIILVHPTCSPFVTQIANTPLPVDFINVDLEVVSSGIAINWSTASEAHNEKFVVERSYDGYDWVEVAEVAGAGNSNTILHYSAIDASANTNATAFYRVRQYDYDGKNEATDVIKYTPAVIDFSVYPNPTNENQVTLNAKNISEIGASDIVVTNLVGKSIAFDYNENSQTMKFDVLVDGVYIINIKGQRFRLVKL